jgi:ABC-type Fe3+/spermidine/putrescine transport system ATPase subunit
MVMAQKIAVMRAGRFEQIGTPRMIYEEPATRFVAGFIGDANQLDGTVVDAGQGLCTVELAKGARVEARGASVNGAKVTVMVRPEHVQLGGLGLPGVVIDCAYRGDVQMMRVELRSGDLVRVASFGSQMSQTPKRGEQVLVSFAPQAARVLAL